MFWVLIIALGVAWVTQSYLSFQQTKAFSQLFVSLRRRGRVSLGKFRGGLAQGSIVMFLLDEHDRVVEGHRLNGVTVLSRFKTLPDFDGQPIGELDPLDASPHGRSVVKAVENARVNYRIIASGGHAPEPPTALARLVGGLPGRGRRKAAKAEAAISSSAPVGRPSVVPAPSSRYRRKEAVPTPQ